VSPHQDERPEGEKVRLVVIHNISLPPGEFGGPYIDDLFMGTANGIYRSSNLGASWKVSPLVLSFSSIPCISFRATSGMSCSSRQ